MAFVLADPSDPPPDQHQDISEFINVGSDSQEKAGSLSVANLITPEMLLNTDTDDDHREGSINRIDRLKGDDTLDGMYLGSNEFNDAEIYLDKTNQSLVFSNNSSESLKINNNGVYISELESCVLSTDADGKIGCYSSEPPGTGYGGETIILSINKIDNTDNPPDEYPVEDFCKIGSAESCGTDNEVVAKITMDLLSVERITDGSCSITVSPYLKSHFYIKESGSSAWDLKESLDLTIGCWTIHQFSPFGPDCKCAAGSKSGEWYYHLKQGDEIKITAQVWEPAFFGPLANLRAKVSVGALGDIRPNPAQGFAYSDAEILYYYDPNTTGLMNIYNTPEESGQYLFPIEQSTVFSVDGFPIFIDN